MQNFNGDFEQLAATMRSSWSENKEHPLLYTTEFLHSAFEQPGSTFDLAPAIYDGTELAAFGAAFPRRIRYEGREFRVALDSFITVAKSHRGKRLGGSIWTEIATRCKQQNLDGLITFCVEGDHMNELLLKYSQAAGFLTERVFSVHYLGRPVSAGTMESVPALETDDFLSCAVPATQHAEFARTWTREEAHWQCAERCGAFGATFEVEGRRGVISAYAMQSDDAAQTMCGLIEDVLWQDLTMDERKLLIRNLMNAGRSRGVQVMLCPVLEYTDLNALRESGFRKMKRTVHMYLTSFRDELPLHALSSAYIDVF